MFTRHLCVAVLCAFVPSFSTAATDTAAAAFIEETTTTGSAGGSASIPTPQPYLALMPLVRVVSDEFVNVGEVKWFAGNFAPRGYELAQGQELQISSNTALFSKLGTTYGGNGVTTFRLPDLRGRAVLGAGNTVQMGRLYDTSSITMTEANLPAHSHGTFDALTTSTTGGSQPMDIRMPSVAMQYKVNTFGIYPSRSNLDSGAEASSSGSSQVLGFVSIDAALDSDPGTLNADGSLQSISSNNALFSLYGTQYGGDGRNTYGLPDTEDRLVVGAGSGPGLTPRSIGQRRGSDEIVLSTANLPSHQHADGPVEITDPAGGGQAYLNLEEEIVINYIIALQGVFPSRGPGGTSSAIFEPFIGEIALFGGNFAPRGWALAQGQLLPINQFQSLFSILGTQFGGDGRTTFGLPDLRGRVPIGVDNFGFGERGGTEFVTLSTAQMAAHTHDITRQIAAPVPLPAGALLLLSGLAAAMGLRRLHAA